MPQKKTLLTILVLTIALTAPAYAEEYCKEISGETYCYELPEELENCTQTANGDWTCSETGLLDQVCEKTASGDYNCWLPRALIRVPVQFFTNISCIAQENCEVNCQTDECTECRYQGVMCTAGADLLEDGDVFFEGTVLKGSTIETMNTTISYKQGGTMFMLMPPTAMLLDEYKQCQSHLDEDNYTIITCDFEDRKALVDGMVDKSKPNSLLVSDVWEYKEPGTLDQYGLLLPILAGAAAIIILYYLAKKRAPHDKKTNRRRRRK